MIFGCFKSFSSYEVHLICLNCRKISFLSFALSLTFHPISVNIGWLPRKKKLKKNFIKFESTKR